MGERSIDRELATVVAESSRHSGDFATLAASFGAGVPPDKAKAKQVGMAMAEQGKRLKVVLDELEKATDFQAKESYHVLEMKAQRLNMPTLRTMEQVVNWQADGLFAFAEGRPLAPMPAGVDAQALGAAAPGPAGANPMQRNMFEPTLPRCLPFTLEDFDAAPDVIAGPLRSEFEKLVKDHDQLIGLGRSRRTGDGRETSPPPKLPQSASATAVRLMLPFRACKKKHTNSPQSALGKRRP